MSERRREPGREEVQRMKEGEEGEQENAEPALFAVGVVCVCIYVCFCVCVVKRWPVSGCC